MLIVALVLSAPTLAQSWEQIRSNAAYLTGYGTGATVAEADQNALADLISKISVHVKSEFDQTEEETDHNGSMNGVSRIFSRVKSYSQTTLNNTEQLIINNEPDAVVGRYVKKAEVDRIFEARKRKVCDLVDEAQKAEAAAKVDDALRQYYWAYTLLKSLPHSSEVSHQGHALSVWIPQQMNNVFDDIHAQITSSEGSDVNLAFTFRGQPVSSLDYTYFDGRRWSNIYSAKDGIGVLELSATARPDNIQLKFEYEYRGEARIDKEIENVIAIEKSTSMRKSYQNLSVNAAKPNKVVEQARAMLSSAQTNPEMAQRATNAAASAPPKMPAPVTDAKAYQDLINKVVTALRTRNYAAARNCFDSEGAEVFDKLIHYGSARVVGSAECTFYPYREWIMARSVPMSFSFKGGVRKSFVEDVVFTINPRTHKICNLTFGLGLTAERDILGKGAWEERFRMQVIDFMENYKTAYALGRFDYLKSIFDDNAIIITGRIVKESTLTRDREGMAQVNNNKYVKFTRQSKADFLKNLEIAFRSKEFVNLRFGHNDVTRMGKNDNIFGIQIKQDYYSDNYGDTGYLFLMVDMERPDEPLIKVRTWQPEKDKNYGVIGPGDF